MADLRETLDQLKTASEKVTPFSALAHIVKNLAEYDVKSGECKGVGLLHIPEVAIQFATMGPGTHFECHTHDEQEIIILIEGDLMIRFKNYGYCCIKGYPLVIEPGKPHTAISQNGAKVVALTIPASKDFPDGK